MNSDFAQIVRARLLSEGHYEIALRGRCMEPLLLAGDRARIRFGEGVRVGDIVLAELENGESVLHRAVGMDGGRVRTKGDFSGKSEVVDRGSIIGVASEFSLFGKGWVKDPRSRDEILKLVEMSVCIEGRGWEDSVKDLRKMIWKANCATRRAMLEELNGVRFASTMQTCS